VSCLFPNARYVSEFGFQSLSSFETYSMVCRRPPSLPPSLLSLIFLSSICPSPSNPPFLSLSLPPSLPQVLAPEDYNRKGDMLLFRQRHEGGNDQVGREGRREGGRGEGVVFQQSLLTHILFDPTAYPPSLPLSLLLSWNT